jgi:ATP-dependent Lon protease
VTTLTDKEMSPVDDGGEKREDLMGERFTLPVLPLRDTVVYPGVAVPISAGRPGTVEAVQRALDGDRRMFAVAQRENVDDALPEYLYNVGTVVRIIQTHRVRGGVQLLVQGEGRAQALSYHDEGESMLHAVLLDLKRQEPRNATDPAFQALDRELRDRAAELGTRRGVPAEALNQLIQGVGEPGPFADLVGFYLELETQQKQDLLEMLDDEDRMRACLVAVERELARIDAQEDIQAKVQSELGERQREMLLREQLKAIQKELGEEEERDDVEEMRERIGELELSEEQRSEVDRELRRLERTSPQSAEYQVIRTFLEWITELPWNERAEEKIDLAKAQKILEDDHHGLEDVKDRILEFLAVRKLHLERADAAKEAEKESGESPTKDAPEAKPGDHGHVHGGRGPILLFVGPPGVGKTSIAQSIAR